MLRTYLLTAGADHEAATLLDGLIQIRQGSFLPLAWKWLDAKDSQGHTAPVTSEPKTEVTVKLGVRVTMMR